MAQEIVNKIIEKASSLTDLIGDIKESGSEMIDSYFSDLQDSPDIIKRSGYVLNDIEVHLGLPPEITGIFTFERNISDEEWENLLAETEGKSHLNALLKGLYKAERISEKIELGKFKLDAVQITLSIPPQIGLMFKPKE